MNDSSHGALTGNPSSGSSQAFESAQNFADEVPTRES